MAAVVSAISVVLFVAASPWAGGRANSARAQSESTAGDGCSAGEQFEYSPGSSMTGTDERAPIRAYAEATARRLSEDSSRPSQSSERLVQLWTSRLQAIERVERTGEAPSEALSTTWTAYDAEGQVIGTLGLERDVGAPWMVVHTSFRVPDELCNPRSEWRSLLSRQTYTAGFRGRPLS